MGVVSFLNPSKPRHWFSHIPNLRKISGWTHSIRELENTLSEAPTQARGQVLLLEDLKHIMFGRKELHVSGSSVSRSLTKEQIEQTLHETGWNRTEAAKILGISRPTLRKKMRKYEIIPPEGGKNECVFTEKSPVLSPLMNRIMEKEKGTVRSIGYLLSGEPPYLFQNSLIQPGMYPEIRLSFEGIKPEA